MIYLLILLYLLLLSFLYDYGGIKVGKNINYFLLLIILICLSGFRYKVGGDTYRYMFVHDLFIPNISELLSSNNGFALVKLQPFWLLLSSLAKTISEDFYVVQIMHAIIVNSVIFHFFAKNTVNKFTAILFYYVGFYCHFNFEILRESLAISFFLLSVPYFKRREWGPYYIFCIIGFMFHLSAIITFIFPFVSKFKFKIYWGIPVICVALSLNIYMLPILIDLKGEGGIIQSMLTYAGYEYTLIGLVFIIINYVFFPFVLMYVLKKGLHVISDNYAFLHLYIWIGISVCFFFIFWRFLNYLIPFLFLFMVEILRGITIKRNLTTNRIPLLCIAFTFMLVYSTSSYFKKTDHLVEGSHFYDRWHPYYSIFSQETHPVRDELVQKELIKSQ